MKRPGEGFKFDNKEMQARYIKSGTITESCLDER